jgi:hypothetical protein
MYAKIICVSNDSSIPESIGQPKSYAKIHNSAQEQGLDSDSYIST